MYAKKSLIIDSINTYVQCVVFSVSYHSIQQLIDWSTWHKVQSRHFSIPSHQSVSQSVSSSSVSQFFLSFFSQWVSPFICQSSLLSQCNRNGWSWRREMGWDAIRSVDGNYTQKKPIILISNLFWSSFSHDVCGFLRSGRRRKSRQQQHHHLFSVIYCYFNNLPFFHFAANDFPL